MAKANAGTTARQLRLVHLYLGAVFAPALLFFALTGALQVFSLHKAQAGSTTAPPAWIVQMAAVHKQQALAVPKHASPDGKAEKPDGTRGRRTPPPAKGSTLALKLFALAASAGLIVSTLIGLYLACRFSRRPRLVLALALAGLLLPVALLYL